MGTYAFKKRVYTGFYFRILRLLKVLNLEKISFHFMNFSFHPSLVFFQIGINLVLFNSNFLQSTLLE